MVEPKCGFRLFWLELDTWPRSAISDLLFIARRPRRVLPTSFTMMSRQHPPGTTGDEAAFLAPIYQTNFRFF